MSATKIASTLSMRALKKSTMIFLLPVICTGESKTEKLLVPSAVLPHTLCVLLNTASAIHDVLTPALPLHGATVQVKFLKNQRSAIGFLCSKSCSELTFENAPHCVYNLRRVYSRAFLAWRYGAAASGISCCGCCC